MLFFLKLNNRYGGKMLTVTSFLLLALASAAPVLHAQEWDQLNGRDKAHDPTVAWLLKAMPREARLSSPSSTRAEL